MCVHMYCVYTCTVGLDKRDVCKLGVWIRGVSAIQGSGLKGCLQFRGLD